MSIRTPQARYEFRKIRTRKKIFGTAERPRLSVYRSSKHIYAQIVDDARGHTLAAVSSLSEDTGTTIGAAKVIGKSIADKAKALKVVKVVFDRGGRPYHGRIRAVAEGAREAGLEF